MRIFYGAEIEKDDAGFPRVFDASLSGQNRFASGAIVNGRFEIEWCQRIIILCCPIKSSGSNRRGIDRISAGKNCR